MKKNILLALALNLVFGVNLCWAGADFFNTSNAMNIYEMVHEPGQVHENIYERLKSLKRNSMAQRNKYTLLDAWMIRELYETQMAQGKIIEQVFDDRFVELTYTKNNERARDLSYGMLDDLIKLTSASSAVIDIGDIFDQLKVVIRKSTFNEPYKQELSALKDSVEAIKNVTDSTVNAFSGADLGEVITQAEKGEHGAVLKVVNAAIQRLDVVGASVQASCITTVIE